MTHVDVLSPLANDVPRLEEERQRAVRQEMESWTRVKGKHPGQAGHDGNAWREWQALANRVQVLAAALKPAEHKGHRRR